MIKNTTQSNPQQAIERYHYLLNQPNTADTANALQQWVQETVPLVCSTPSLWEYVYDSAAKSVHIWRSLLVQNECLQTDLARALYDFGVICFDFGCTQYSHAHLREALTIFKEADENRRTRDWEMTGKCYYQYALVLRDLHDYNACYESALRGALYLQKVARRHRDLRKSAGDTYALLASVCHDLKKDEEANDWMRKAIKVYLSTDLTNRKSGKQNNEERTLLMFLSGRMSWDAHHNAMAAWDYLYGAYSMAQGFDQPDEQFVHDKLVAMYHYETALVFAQEKLDVSIHELLEAIALQKKLIAQDCRMGHELAKSYLTLGNLYRQIGHDNRAQDCYANCLHTLQTLQQAFPQAQLFLLQECQQRMHG